MSAHSKDPALADHLAWLGYVQPEGLVVLRAGVADAQAIIDRSQLGDLQRQLRRTRLRFADCRERHCRDPARHRTCRACSQTFLAGSPDSSTASIPPRAAADLHRLTARVREVLAPTLVLRNDRAIP